VTPQEYVAERLSRELAWYERAATKSRCLLFGSTTAGGVLAALIPVLVAFDVPTEFIALAGAGSAFASALAATMGWRDNWVRYRLVAEDLLRERWLFDTRSGPYRQLTEPEAFAELVQSVEGLLLDERRQWTQNRDGADRSASGEEAGRPVTPNVGHFP